MIKYTLEYPIHSSIKILYARLSTLSGLSEWFADDVNVNRDGLYTFSWEGSQQHANLVSKKKDSHIRFRWEDSSDEEYFEFFIQIDELTKDVSLIVTDFADDEMDKEDAIQLWDVQIDKLKSTIGS
ncbi:MAG: START-like domain-containing protein [Flavobacteriales bacterium]